METEIVKDNKNTNIFKKIIQIREFSIIIIILIACILLSFSNENFLSITNMRVIVQGFSIDMIAGVAACISLIAGNIDFSVGSIVGFSGVVTAMMLGAGIPIILAILIGLIAGTILGFFNGFIITKFKLLPLVATIGTWMAYKGLTLVVSGGRSSASLPKEFKAIGQGTTMGIPTTVFIMIIIVAIGMFALRKIDFFHKAYYIGGNKKSAELAGIAVNKFTIIMYMINGFMCGLAGILLASRLGNANVSSGAGMEFRLVVALLIGGVSFDGGEGTLTGAALGIILMGIVRNALVMLSVSPYWTDLVIGLILIFAVALDTYNKTRKERA